MTTKHASGDAAATPLQRGLQQLRPTAQLGLRRLLGRRSPFQMSFSLTNRCNFRCEYCAIPTQRLDEMTTEEWFRVIDEFRAGGMGRTSLLGGEPLIRDDVGEIIRYLNRVGVHSAMNTNGWWVSERIEDVSRLDLVCMSLDGPEEVHDAQRRKGSYRRLIDGMERLRQRGMQVATMSVITVNSSKTIRHVLDIAKSMGTQAYFQLVHNEHVDVNAPIAPDLSNVRVRQLMDQLVDLKKRGWPVGNSFGVLERQKRGRYISRCEDCFAGSYFGYVFSDGTVAPCLLMKYQAPRNRGREVGFLKAFHEMGPPVGPGCSCTATHEVNQILEFDPRALFDALEASLGRRRGMQPMAVARS